MVVSTCMHGFSVIVLIAFRLPSGHVYCEGDGAHLGTLASPCCRCHQSATIQRFERTHVHATIRPGALISQPL